MDLSTSSSNASVPPPDIKLGWATGSADSAEVVSVSVRVITLLSVILPFAGLAAAIGLLWGWGFSWVHLGLLLGLYVVTALGVTVGYHRLFTHHAFETNSVVKYILGVMGAMAMEGPVLKWAAMHRRHHQHSDEVGDPHSPHHHGTGVKGLLLGAWHAHVGWIFDPDPPELANYVPDLASQPVIRSVSKAWMLWSAFGLILPAVLGGVITRSWSGALLGFIWGGLARVFLVHHLTWSVNSICHLWGTRPFRTTDLSRNNVIFGVLGFGEGWHNNHHAFPTSARHGLRWWQVDMSYWVIRGLEAVGLAWKVRVPPAAAVQVKRGRESLSR